LRPRSMCAAPTYTLPSLSSELLAWTPNHTLLTPPPSAHDQFPPPNMLSNKPILPPITYIERHLAAPRRCFYFCGCGSMPTLGSCSDASIFVTTGTSRSATSIAVLRRWTQDCSNRGHGPQPYALACSSTDRLVRLIIRAWLSCSSRENLRDDLLLVVLGGCASKLIAASHAGRVEPPAGTIARLRAIHAKGPRDHSSQRFCRRAFPALHSPASGA
jgi:hypothetical protein